MTELRRSMSGAAVKIEPHVDSITPPGGSPGILVLIRGFGFEQMAAVLFDEDEAEVISMTQTEIRCLAPEHDPGTCEIHLVMPNGGRVLAGQFTYY